MCREYKKCRKMQNNWKQTDYKKIKEHIIFTNADERKKKAEKEENERLQYHTIIMWENSYKKNKIN